ncbi:MAG TPA: HEXXH motif-containing putative peptide modification protein [Verrucomicrobiae bacterium]|nr:HEXXH motif-containing putative peptide modification protein [Verrucomicrobiae bacterium]
MNSTQEEKFSVRAPENLYDFEPSIERVHFLSQRMRSGLAESLRYIFQQANEALELPSERIEIFLSQLESKSISPQAFCFYHDAVLAIEEDRIEDASRLLDELIHLPPHSGGPIILALPDPVRDPAGRRYARFVDTDATATFAIFPPTTEAVASCRAQIQDALALMEAGDPELAAEIRALVLEIILAAGIEDPKAMTFDGASAFMLWGAIMINANRRDGEIGMVQMLAHESAHNLLFGFCSKEPLVENSPDELFRSPLRVDPRPMEGIYHATFVTARMHRAVKHLIDSGILSGSSLEKARKDLAENARLFALGIETVRQHGKLSAMGAAIMQGASDYMAANA